jgi:hypothetical protein
MPPRVQRDQEEVRALDLGNPFVRPIGLEQRVAKRSIEAIQDRGLDQEPAQLLGLPTQHLFHQIVREMPLLAGERGDEFGSVVARTEREPGQVQARDPTLGAFEQQLELAVLEGKPEPLVEKQLDPVLVEPQLLLGHLPQLSAHPQSRHTHRRRNPRGDREVDTGRTALEEERDSFVDLRLADHVVVVENEHDARGGKRQRVHQLGQADVLRRDRGRCERRVDRARDCQACVAERADDVRPEANRVVVSLVQREPGEWDVAVLRRAPLGQQRGLSGPGGGLEQGQPPVQAVSQLLDQARPGDVPVTDARPLDLRRQDRQLGHMPLKS